LKEFDKLQNKIASQKDGELNYSTVDGKMAFDLYQSYGFPIEMFFEELEKRNIFNFEKEKAQIEFEAEHYEEAYQLVKFWRERNAYVGGMIMEYLKAEKAKL
jgi:alanyl-tRNA synthetase